MTKTPRATSADMIQAPTNGDLVRAAYRSTSEPRSGHILVVDDEVEIARFVAEALRDEGFSVQTRHDGASALVEITNHPPALVLLDIAMPVMIGDELLRHLRGNGFEELPVIVMTAGLHPERYRLAGADEVLPKPFDIDALIAAVKRYLSPH
jgi:two-component system, OmpR family, KDP operon response regulator KdpE